ncbi:MAG: iron complex transport system ATP-binding protein [Motiliproteus sp.]|jgi:iron complex transport system ATP-binding protein
MLLELSQVSCELYGKTLLNIDKLAIMKGEFYGLLGPNGAGKSTLLKVISGDLHSQGHIYFHGQSLNTFPALERARHLAVLPQASQLTFSFSAQEVVSLGLTPLSLNRRDAERAVRLEMLATDCLHFADRSYPSLSGGERQRVQLARVLLQLSQATSTPLLLLDEPTSAQDLGQQHSILQLSKHLCSERGYSVVAILHDLNQVLRYCDRCCVLNNGVMTHEGKPNELLTNEMIESTWQYRPQRITLADGQIAVV